MLGAVADAGRSVAVARGPFALLGLFRREGLEWPFNERWDVLASAPWMTNRGEATDVIADALKAAVGGAGLMNFSQVVILSQHDRFLTAILRSPGLGPFPQRVAPGVYGGVAIADGYVVARL